MSKTINTTLDTTESLTRVMNYMKALTTLNPKTVPFCSSNLVGIVISGTQIKTLRDNDIEILSIHRDKTQTSQYRVNLK